MASRRGSTPRRTRTGGRRAPGSVACRRSRTRSYRRGSFARSGSPTGSPTLRRGRPADLGQPVGGGRGHHDVPAADGDRRLKRLQCSPMRSPRSPRRRHERSLRVSAIAGSPSRPARRASPRGSGRRVPARPGADRARVGRVGRWRRARYTPAWKMGESIRARSSLAARTGIQSAIPIRSTAMMRSAHAPICGVGRDGVRSHLRSEPRVDLVVGPERTESSTLSSPALQRRARRRRRASRSGANSDQKLFTNPPLRPLGPPPQMSCSSITMSTPGSSSVRYHAVHIPV